MHLHQRRLLAAFGDLTAMERVLQRISIDLCGCYSPAGALMVGLSGFLATLEQWGEAYLEIPLGDQLSTIVLWARRNAMLLEVQLTPTLQSANAIRRAWETDFTSEMLYSPVAVPQRQYRRAA